MVVSTLHKRATTKIHTKITGKRDKENCVYRFLSIAL